MLSEWCFPKVSDPLTQKEWWFINDYHGKSSFEHLKNHQLPMISIDSSWKSRFGTCFIFPYIGNDHPYWRTHIFQRGWNHQPDMFMADLLGFMETGNPQGRCGGCGPGLPWAPGRVQRRARLPHPGAEAVGNFTMGRTQRWIKHGWNMDEQKWYGEAWLSGNMWKRSGFSNGYW